MSFPPTSSRRKPGSQASALLVGLALFILTSCGFQPMYGDRGPDNSNAFLGSIAVEPIAGGRLGDMMRTALEDRLNPEGLTGAHAPYRLTVALVQSQVPVAIEPDGRILRYTMVLDSNFRLVRASDGQSVYAGRLDHLTAYNVSETNDFSTTIAERDALRRAVSELAEDYRLKLAAWLAEHPAPAL